MGNLSYKNICARLLVWDETTDVSTKEQLNLSISWVNDDYAVIEDPVGLFALLNTSADTITQVIARC